jgi:ABC-type uncharacterized transport system substrate-binding protein
MDRRQTMLALIAIGSAPLAAKAQQTKVPIVGVLRPHSLDPAFSAFLDGLRELGYDDGRNMRLVVRSAETKLERLSGLATELAQMKPDVIVAINTPGTRAAIRATTEIPIIMAIVGNPVATGFVSNMSRPGGNVTGVSNLTGELAAKRLQLLKEIVPAAKRIAVLLNPDDPVTSSQVRDAERAAPLVGLEVRFFPVRDRSALEAAFKEFSEWRADAATWLAGQADVFIKPAVSLATRHRCPMMFTNLSAVRAGGLIAYAADHKELYRRVAVYVDKILKGAKPSDLPVEEPTKFVLAINLKTAKTMGLRIPQSILLRADEVSE